VAEAKISHDNAVARVVKLAHPLSRQGVGASAKYRSLLKRSTPIALVTSSPK